MKLLHQRLFWSFLINHYLGENSIFIFTKKMIPTIVYVENRSYDPDTVNSYDSQLLI